MLKVMHLSVSMGYGGIERLICDLTHHIADSAVSVCCLDSIGPLGEKLRDRGDLDVFCLHRKPGLDIRLCYRLYRVLKQAKTEVLHTHNEAALFYGSIAGVLARVPVHVNTEHSRHYIDEKN